MKIMFDVGANNGLSSWEFVKQNYQVFAFEPLPQKCLEIRANYPDKANVFIIQKAVADFEGEREFNVHTKNPDWGCSSFLGFRDPEFLIEKWTFRAPEFEFSSKIVVNVIRMDTFVSMLDIDHIDYFHCDAQGMDLPILRGFGNKISIIKEGVIETVNERDILYKNSDNFKDDAIEFLEKSGFKIKKLEFNDPHKNETNIYFEQL